MIEERDIAVFVLPFALGSAISLALRQVTFHTSIHLQGITLCLVAICLTALLHRLHKGLNSKILWTTVILAALCCGILCGQSVTSVFPDAEHAFGPVRRFSEFIKDALAEIQFENPRTNAVATALITGDKSGLNIETTDAFRKSGASHILALSGMHLGIIYGLLKLLFMGLGNSPAARRMKSCLNILICGFYTLSTGAGPSISRAFLFITLAEIAMISGRRTSLKGVFFTSLLIQLILSPEDITNVGFLLSYAAIAGIAFIYPRLRDFWPQDTRNTGWTGKALKWIWNSAALSIACQITTAPIAYAVFGTFPKYFLITNLVAVPMIGMIIPAILFVLALSICGITPGFFGHAAEWFVDALIYCLTVISSL